MDARVSHLVALLVGIVGTVAVYEISAALTDMAKAMSLEPEKIAVAAPPAPTLSRDMGVAKRGLPVSTPSRDVRALAADADRKTRPERRTDEDKAERRERRASMTEEEIAERRKERKERKAAMSPEEIAAKIVRKEQRRKDRAQQVIESFKAAATIDGEAPGLKVPQPLEVPYEDTDDFFEDDEAPPGE